MVVGDYRLYGLKILRFVEIWFVGQNKIILGKYSQELQKCILWFWGGGVCMLIRLSLIILMFTFPI